MFFLLCHAADVAPDVGMLLLVFGRVVAAAVCWWCPSCHDSSSWVLLSHVILLALLGVAGGADLALLCVLLVNVVRGEPGSGGVGVLLIASFCWSCS